MHKHHPGGLADISRQDLSDIAEALRERAEPCPWNPFPLDSEWGRKIEDAYRRERNRKDQPHG